MTVVPAQERRIGIFWGRAEVDRLDSPFVRAGRRQLLGRGPSVPRRTVNQREFRTTRRMAASSFSSQALGVAARRSVRPAKEESTDESAALSSVESFIQTSDTAVAKQIGNSATKVPIESKSLVSKKAATPGSQ
jgi:hypothetical protein